MRRLASWIARHVDGGLTPVGAALGLALMLSGVGAAVALTSGSLLLGAVLGVPFLLGLVLLFMAAHYTDPNGRMTGEQKRQLWRLMPASMKRAAIVLAVGIFAGAMLTGPVGHAVSWTLITVSEVLLVLAMRREAWPLPDGKGGWITEAGSPQAYRLRRKQALRSAYLAITISAAMALLPLLRH